MILTRALSYFSPTMLSFCRLSTTVRIATVMTLVAATMLLAPAAQGATINYGNYNVPSAGISFLDVTESSITDAVPMYNEPAPFAVGLKFKPGPFGSSSTNGSVDITDGQLNFTIAGLVNPNGFVGINTLNLSEFGDYNLIGVGTATTLAQAGAIMRLTVSEVNGLPVVPFTLPPVNASVGFNLASNPGMSQPWSVNLFYDLSIVMPQGQVATRVDVAIDNTLATISQPGTIAFIAKKGFQIDLTPGTTGMPFVPEPTTLVLSMLAGAAVVACRRPRA